MATDHNFMRQKIANSHEWPFAYIPQTESLFVAGFARTLSVHAFNLSLPLVQPQDAAGARSGALCAVGGRGTLRLALGFIVEDLMRIVLSWSSSSWMRVRRCNDCGDRNAL